MAVVAGAGWGDLRRSTREGVTIWKVGLTDALVPPVPYGPGAAFLVCCLKKVQGPDTVRPSKGILDKRGTYIFGNAVSKRKVKLWAVF